MSTTTDFSIYKATEPVLTFVRCTWINPHPTKSGTPVEQGGIIWDAAEPIECGGKPFSVTYSSGRTQEVCGGRGFVVIPIRMSNPYTIVTSSDPAMLQQVIVPQPLYMRSDYVPNEFRVSSAVTFFFVLHNDPANTLMSVQLRSHGATLLNRAYFDWVKTVAKLGNHLLRMPLDVRALPVKFGAGETVMVGRNQKSPIAAPIFRALRQYKNVEELQSDLVPPERFKALLEMADDDMIKQYPAIPAIKIASTLDEAYAVLGEAFKDEQQPKALPSAAKSAKQIVEEGEGEYF
jgi:hypothetical protein